MRTFHRAVSLASPAPSAMNDACPLNTPNVADVSVFRVTPVVISLLDYSKGFGHTDLVAC